MMRNTRGNGWVLLLVLLCGIIVGGFIGEVLGNFIPILKYGYNLGVTPHTYDLRILKITFGLSFNINMFSILGIIISIIVYRRL
ncbi:DUF4321 domain-containing protein [Lutispora thermophila]|uniref:DUF4321 domain-containing protein n=1 Tax=Lutispora thermophila DSM 19022 TaxID=1122184 RepID=A0A1M6FS78_9FIRM|nr:DUF4321 domain-containing protein [Lutispora thermophila]SHJ00544.1 protein of unknown function [Lutispora thermophila DSM 19022]